MSQSEGSEAIPPSVADDHQKSTATGTTLPAEPALPDANQPSASGSDEKQAPEEPRKKFTVYDIWCSGLTSDVYAAINESDEETWTSILWASQRWQQIYQAGDEEATQLQKSQNPSAAIDPEFFSQWIPKDLLNAAIRNI